MKTAARNAESQTRRLQALELRIAGNSFADIGRELKITRQSAHRLVRAELARVATENADAAENLSVLETRRLDWIAERLVEIANDEKQPSKARISALGCLVKVCDSRARLLGLNKDTQRLVDAEVASCVGLLVSQIATVQWRVVKEIAGDDMAKRIANRMLEEIGPLLNSSGGLSVAQAALSAPAAVDPSTTESDDSHTDVAWKLDQPQ